jgi:hypothetical protein
METTLSRFGSQVLDPSEPGQSERFVTAPEFCRLMLSHRRMERLDQRDHKVRGLRDLDTGEVFLTDERRLLEASR